MNETGEAGALERAAQFNLPKLRQWYAEQIAHSSSGDGAEVEVTWSLDLDEAVGWCGVLDPSVSELEMIDWSEDWSFQELPQSAEGACPGQGPELALMSPEDVSSTECVQ